MGPLCQLELQILERIASQHPQAAPALRAQIPHASATDRSNSGCGFFTHLHIEESTELITTGGPIGNVCISVDGLEHGVHFLLFLNEGRVSMLEGWTVGDDDTTGLDLPSLSYEFTA